MASISPFHGIRYNPKTCPDLGAVITPPYDVIQPQEQEEYYRRSPYNIIRLEYGQTDPGDSAADNRYTRAAAAFRQWLAEEVLIREKEKAIYRYEQSFVHNNTATCGQALSLPSRWSPMKRSYCPTRRP